MASIKIHRPNNFVGRLRAFSVYLNDKKIGTVSNGETKEFQISAGNHKIYCKQDFFNSPFIYSFSIEENQTKSLKAAYKQNSMVMLAILFSFIFSAILSQFLTVWLKVNIQYWLGFYILFAFAILLILRALKIFTIFVTE